MKVYRHQDLHHMVCKMLSACVDIFESLICKRCKFCNVADFLDCGFERMNSLQEKAYRIYILFSRIVLNQTVLVHLLQALVRKYVVDTLLFILIIWYFPKTFKKSSFVVFSKIFSVLKTISGFLVQLSLTFSFSATYF